MKVKLLVGCARCGRDHHNVNFEELLYPVLERDVTVATHWAPCPQNGQPIMLIMQARA